MIDITNTAVTGFDAAFRGMRNPMNSWEKSDSAYFCDDCEKCPWQWLENCDAYHVGEADMTLAKKLIASGDDHGKFLRMINVSCDIKAPLYWWKEFDTYKVGTVADSCSTMHKLTAKEFDISDFSTDGGADEYGTNTMNALVVLLNDLRERYIGTKDKNIWRAMVQILPCSYMQLRTVSTNYAVLRRMYAARKAHKLTEWHDFCRWVESLPYADGLLV